MKTQDIYVAKINIKCNFNETYYILANSLKEALNIAEQYVKENSKIYHSVISIENANYKIIIPKNND